MLVTLKTETGENSEQLVERGLNRENCKSELDSLYESRIVKKYRREKVRLAVLHYSTNM